MNPETPNFDILVVGAGPAGLAAAAALAERGLRVGSLAPEHPPKWPNTYGIWCDELAAVGMQDCVERVWEKAAVLTGRAQAHHLQRSYARLDNQKAIAYLIDRAERGDITWIEGVAKDWRQAFGGVEIDAGPSDSTQAPQQYNARLVIDASGHMPALSQRGSDVAPAWQSAWGIMARCEGNPMPAGASMALMDFSPIDGVSDTSEPASFLYAMDMGDGRYFLEETVLAARPAFKIERLEERLNKRLKMRGVEVLETLETERVAIPMGLSLPQDHSHIVAFGGAASMVHPATGYMLGRALQAADPMADAIAAELGRPGGVSARAAAAARQAIWPDGTRRTRELLLFGLETLLKLDAAQTRAFFDAFFRLDPTVWAAYLSGIAPPGLTAQTMLKVFGTLSPALKLRFARAGFSEHSAHLLRAASPSFLSRFQRREDLSKL